MKARDKSDQIEQGLTAEANGDYHEAANLYEQAAKVEEFSERAYYLLGRLFFRKKKYAVAINYLRNALIKNPKNPEILGLIGALYYKIDSFKNAEVFYSEALKNDKRNVQIKNNLALNAKAQGNYTLAKRILIDVIQQKPSFEEARLNYAILLYENGEHEDAKKHFLQIINKNPTNFAAHRLLTNLISGKNDNQQFMMLSEIKEETLSGEDLSNWAFALAKLHEDRSEFEEAYKYLKKGNNARKEILGYSFEDDETFFAKLRQCQAQLDTIDLSISDNRKANPIFIIGMPRSGTTLVEQILSSHPDINGGGELPFVNRMLRNLVSSGHFDKNDLSTFRENYLSQTEYLWCKKSIFTDKMPHNFRYVKFIRVAFPNAKIVHVKRNASAVCWSNFRQHFTQAGLGYSCNLTDTVNYYNLYVNLLVEFENDPVTDLINVDYDQLVNEPEKSIKALISKLNLKWDEACLRPDRNMRAIQTASTTQIRKKIYSNSSLNWKSYAESVPELAKILGKL